MGNVLKAIRGTKDMLPEESPYWQHVESLFRDVVSAYDYQEIRTPVLEETALFSRSIGNETDIVSKEMYSFEDRNGDSLSLRPEGTACVVRAGIQAGLFHNQWQRLWYVGPMFRHERPQKGRYRQFHHAGVEAYGYVGSAIEAEVIAISHELLNRLGILDEVTCQINHLGEASERAAFREALVDYLTPHKNKLDEDSQRRLSTNPLRILDSKVPATQELLQDAPTLMDFLSDESREHLSQLQEMLSSLGIQTVVNPSLVRGLDYYTGVVFEWVTESLGAQGTVCAGGRYDGLVEQLGGRATPAFGFAAGLERLILILQERDELTSVPDLCVIPGNPAFMPTTLEVASLLREHFPAWRVSSQLAGRSLKATMKQVFQLNPRYTCVISTDESGMHYFDVKNLETRESRSCSTQTDLIDFLRENT